MKRQFNSFLAVAALAAVALVNAEAATYTTTGGASYDGDISKVIDGVVTIDTGADKVEVALADFDAASQGAIKSWSAQHPEAVDVYMKWDVQPRIKSSVLPSLPEALATPNFAGMVAVDLILDESGQVIHASISKSTHAELEAPSVEAAKTWIFEPAKIGGKAVKAKLRVPFKFTYNPPAPPQG